MATIGLPVTMLDVQRRLDPNNKIAALIEMMTQTNNILQDMIHVEGNLPTGHRTTTRTGLPTATWRLLNYGVIPTKSATKQVDDSCGMLEARSQVDVDLAMLNGNTAAWRLSEDQAHLQGMNNQMATALFYGNSSLNPEQFTGLAPRYNALGTNPLISTYNTVNAGSVLASHATSIWLVSWGANASHGIFPLGSQGGFNMWDLGEQSVNDDQTPAGQFQALVTRYQWKLGLCVRDWRYNVRICNIDTGAAGDTIVADLVTFMIRALYKLPEVELGNKVFYANSLVMQYLDLQTLAKANLWLSYADIQGRKVLTFRGIPIRRCDALLNTEELLA